jgi:hypothetical protein
LNGSSGRVKLLLEIFYRAVEVTFNSFFQGAVFQFSSVSAVGSKVLPEKRVVDVAYESTLDRRA